MASDACLECEGCEVCRCECGKPRDSYACRIRHVSINTGWAKAAND